MAGEKRSMSNIPRVEQGPKELRWEEIHELLSFHKSYYFDASLCNVLSKLHKFWIQIAHEDWNLAMEIDSLYNL